MRTILLVDVAWYVETVVTEYLLSLGYKKKYFYINKMKTLTKIGKYGS
jgi:hypothetical protein